MSEERRDALRMILPGTFALSAIATLLPLWWVDFLPMTDLPQHAAQIGLWQRLDAGIGHETYRINWFTPYLFGYSMVRVLAVVMPIEAALRVVLSLYVVAMPAALAVWLRALGRPVELALLAFPAAYGFAFHWGFFNFLCALPVALLFLAYGERHLASPSRRSAIGLALFSVFLFFAHVLVLGVCGLVLGARALALRGPVRAVVGMLPTLAGAALIVPWVLVTRANEPGARENTVNWILGSHRLGELPALLFGMIGDSFVASLGGIVVVWVLASLYSAGRDGSWKMLLVPAVGLAVYLLMPHLLMDTWALYPRLGVLLLLTLVPMLAWPSGTRGRAVALGLLLTGVLVYAGVHLHRFRGFDREAAGFEEVLAAAEPDRSMVGLVVDAKSRYLGDRPFMHFPAYYQARGGGLFAMSFAEYYPELVRFQSGKRPNTPRGLEWRADRYDWRKHHPFDYMLVRSKKEPSHLFKPTREGERPRLVKSSGAWWLYERP